MEQIDCCKKAIFHALDDPTSLLDTVRALIILQRLLLDEARMMDCWIYGGLLSQLILPLRWHLRDAQPASEFDIMPFPLVDQIHLPSPLVDQIDLSEGNMIFWMAFLHDTIASLGSGLGGTFAIDEITAPLPNSAQVHATNVRFTSLECLQSPSNPQHLDSSDLWSNHPVKDPFVMLIKAAVLLNRAIKYARLLKAGQYDGCSDDFVLAQADEFRTILNAIGCFQ